MRVLSLVPFAILILVSAARAQEFVADDGWRFASPWRELGAQAPNILFALDDHRFIDRFMQCYGSDTASNLLDVDPGDPHFDAWARHYATSPSHLGVRRGAGTLHVLMAPTGPDRAEATQLLSIRGACDQPATLVAHAAGEAPLPPGLGWGAGLVPIRADGTAYLLADDGLYAVPLDPVGPNGLAGAPSRVLTLEDLASAVSATPDTIRVVAGLITGRDELWLTVDAPAGATLVEVARDGTVTTVLDTERLARVGADPSRLVSVASLDAVAMYAGYELALIPLDPATRAAQRRLATIAIQSSGLQVPLVQASEDRIALAANVVVFELDRLDPDRDLLPTAIELELGTDPHRDDTDADGESDGAERFGLDSDPRDPLDPRVSGVPSGQGAPTFAPSQLISRWPFGHQDAVGRGAPVQYTGLRRGALCVPQLGAFAPGSTPTAFECRDPDGARVPGSPFVALPHLDPEGRPVAFTPAIQAYANPVIVVDADLAFYPSQSLRQLYRQRDGVAFAAIDLDRDCMLLGSESRRADCDAYYQSLPYRDQSLVILGYHAGLGGVLVRLEGPRGALFVVVDAERVRPLAHERAFDGSPIVSLTSTADGLPMATLDGDVRGLARLGAGLAITHLQVDPAAPAPSGPFRHGLFAPSAYAYYVLAGPNGSCFSAFGWTICGKEPPPQPVETRTAVALTEWVPVQEGLERGEVVFWAGGWRTRGYLTVSDPDWALWRMTRLGAVQRWLPAESFAALLDAEGRARLAARPLEAVRMTAASAEPWRLCLVEGQSGSESRLWELSFDPVTRVPTSARFVESGAIACGYGPDGERVVLRASTNEATLVFEGGEAQRLTARAPRDLVRLGASWLVLLEGGQGSEGAVCVEDSTGAYYGLTQSILHAAHADGLVYWIEADGRGKVLAETEFCRGGRQNEEDLYRPAPGMPASFWDVLARAPWESTASGVSFAIRPDGLLVLSPKSLRGVDSAEPNPTWYADLLLGFVPSYVPTYGWDHRLSALDPYRRDAPERHLLSLHAHAVRGISVIPWSERWPDLGWGHLGEDPPTPRNDGPKTPDPVEPEPEPGPETPEPTDDGGCSGGAGGLVSLFALGLVGRGRGRRGRGGRGDWGFPSRRD